MTTDLYTEITRIHREGGAAALATVIGTTGSTPGKASMKMLILRGGGIVGTVGGGCVEAEVLERGREVMRTELCQRFSVDLNEHDNPETGLVCGGRIEIFIEPIVMPTVYVFGAGHVALAVCQVGAPAGFRFVILDDRQEFLTVDRFPLAAERLAGPFAATIAGLPDDPDAFVLVMTRGHREDLEVLRGLAGAGLRPRYLGMIGSNSKHRTLCRQLEEEGVDPEFLEQIRTPIGLPIGARNAEEIAVSVMAELISIRRDGTSS